MANDGPSVQFEILHLVIKLVISFLLARLLYLHELAMLAQPTGSLDSYGFIVSYTHHILSNETVFFSASPIALFLPVLADEIVLKVSLICVVFFGLLAGEVLNLKVREGGCEIDGAANQRVKRNVHLIVFEAILAKDGQRDAAIRVLHVLIVQLLRRFLILFIDREIDIQFHFGALNLGSGAFQWRARSSRRLNRLHRV